MLSIYKTHTHVNAGIQIGVGNLFFSPYFSTKIFVLDNQKDRLNEMLLYSKEPSQ